MNFDSFVLSLMKKTGLYTKSRFFEEIKEEMYLRIKTFIAQELWKELSPPDQTFLQDSITIDPKHFKVYDFLKLKVPNLERKVEYWLKDFEEAFVKEMSQI